MKKTLLTLTLAATALTAAAQTDDYLQLKADARFDWQQVWDDGDTNDADSGFKGKFLNIRLDGTITPGLTYSWRQRLNRQCVDGNFFDATDWIYINYDWRDWSFSAGKQVVAVGNWEYDRAPIDVYAYSVYCSNVPCYDMGASVGYKVADTDKLLLQATQSPFFTTQNRNMYSYNLMWTGSHGVWSPMWSVNLWEYAKGRYINYIALGNRFAEGPVALELDLMNRASSHQAFLFKDCSVMAELSWRPARQWNVFAKYTYDVNRSGTQADLTVLDGTELNMIGAGAEFFPLKGAKRMDLRLHADVFYSWGTNANAANQMQNKTTLFNVGIKWNMNLVNVKRK